MNKAELIKGIDVTINGLTMIKESLTADDGKAITSAPKKEVAKKEATTETADGILSVEEMSKMKYNEFKKYASSLGVKCTGTRDEIMKRILELSGEKVEVEAEETKEEKKPTKVTSIEEGKKKVASKKATKEDEFDEQAKEIAEDTDVEDIIEALSDVGVKATEKNAVTKLAEALRKGLLEFADEEEEEYDDEVEDAEDTVEDDVEETEDEEEIEITADSYFEEFDPDGLNDPEKMTKERKKAVKKLITGVLAQIEEGQITEDDITDYIGDNTTEEEMELLPDEYTDEQLIGFYIELLKRNIDDEGEQHEPSDPYEVNEEDLCCGHILKYSPDTEKYICEICGTEYEAE